MQCAMCMVIESECIIILDTACLAVILHLIFGGIIMNNVIL
jgi:hypothetical protein